MKALQWGDTLCGKTITPEAWRLLRGVEVIIDSPQVCLRTVGEWVIGESLNHLLTRPVYPPRGWADKSEAELWAEMVYDPNALMTVGKIARAEVLVRPTGEVMIDLYDEECESLALPNLAALILALQNAQVMCARLTEVLHG